MIGNGARVYGVAQPTYLYRVATTSVSRSPAAVHSAAALFDDICRRAAIDKHRLAIARRTRRELRARRELFLAYEAAQAGEAGAARRHALGARRGPASVRCEPRCSCVHPPSLAVGVTADCSADRRAGAVAR